MLSLNDKVTSVPYIGDKQADKLGRLGISTVYDLITHFPAKYLDNRRISLIKDLGFEESSNIVATIDDIRTVYTRYRKVIVKTKIRDSSGTYEIDWFNQAFLSRVFRKGELYLFNMKRSARSGKLYCKSYEKVDDDYTSSGGKISPQYPQTKGITSKWLRSRIRSVLDKISQNSIVDLPEEIKQEEGLISLNDAIEQIHFPSDERSLELAKDRLSFEELLSLQILLYKQKKLLSLKDAISIDIDRNNLLDIISKLPFSLTDDQIDSLKNIIDDLGKKTPMHRLLNGDVGAGKTIVAILSMYLVHEAGFSSIILAPTTILAKQHYETFKKFFDPFNINIDLITSDDRIEHPDDSNRMIIGTHALLYRDDLPDNTALVVIDEQHRFGVEQREKIKNTISKTFQPHYLMMTATPIPRTLTNVLYSDMQVSMIRSMPSHRRPIRSFVVENDKKDDCYKWLLEHILETDEQAYIVFPLIEDSDKVQRLAVTTEYKNLKKIYFNEVETALLHGRMKENQKSEIMNDFMNNRTKVLFSTSVIEVGIDVPNSTVMIIESAESFGLAQLHQLRGRVGRGDKQSYCYVIPSKEIEEKEMNIDRLEYFSKNCSGFDIAEYDLKHRGPGEVFGTQQSGIPNLKIADLLDTDMVLRTKQYVERSLESGYVPFFRDHFYNNET